MIHILSIFNGIVTCNVISAASTVPLTVAIGMKKYVTSSPPEIGTVAKPQSLALARHNLGIRSHIIL